MHSFKLVLILGGTLCLASVTGAQEFWEEVPDATQLNRMIRDAALFVLKIRANEPKFYEPMPMPSEAAERLKTLKEQLKQMLTHWATDSKEFSRVFMEMCRLQEQYETPYDSEKMRRYQKVWEIAMERLYLLRMQCIDGKLSENVRDLVRAAAGSYIIQPNLGE